ncbi:MAG: hypothetical protein HYZ14_15370 [Bacteroidetes bacterium]|nr:hypothetical protein [Bacteroidota bacterium]
MSEELLKGGIYMTTKDIELINGCSLRHAQREHRMVRDILRVRPNKLTVKAYCEYMELNYQEIIKYLNHYR